VGWVYMPESLRYLEQEKPKYIPLDEFDVVELVIG
jgi:hypothetical protein